MSINSHDWLMSINNNRLISIINNGRLAFNFFAIFALFSMDLEITWKVLLGKRCVWREHWGRLCHQWRARLAGNPCSVTKFFFFSSTSQLYIFISMSLKLTVDSSKFKIGHVHYTNTAWTGLADFFLNWADKTRVVIKCGFRILA